MSDQWALEAHRRLAAEGFRTGGARAALIGLLAERGARLIGHDISLRVRCRRCVQH